MKNFIFVAVLLSVFSSLSYSQSCLPGGIVFYTQQQVDDFPNNYPNCKEILGNVNIKGNPNGEIKNLDGLNNINSIAGDLSFFHNHLLINIDGLSNIVNIGGKLNFEDNIVLSNLNGLNSLNSIGESVAINNNDKLTDIDGLSSLNSTGGSLKISSNKALTNIDGLSSLSSINGNLEILHNHSLVNIDGLSSIISINGNFELKDNIVLSNLNGLSNIHSIGGGLSIINNTMLTNLNDLNSLISIGGNFIIGSSNALINLDGISNLDSIGGGLAISNNDRLTNLDGLTNLTSIGNYISIEGNLKLTNLNGLIGIDSIKGGLALSYNDALTNLDGLINIISIGSYLEIFFNKALTNCCGIQHLLATPGSVGSTITVFSNPSECSNISEIIESTCWIDIEVNTFSPCIDASNGSIQIIISGYDTIPFFYNWEKLEDNSIGSGTSYDNIFSIDNLSSGTYNITITTPNQDTAILTGIVLSNELGSIFEIVKVTTTNSSNGISNGSILLQISGGTAPYSYTWSGQSSGSQNGIMTDTFKISPLRWGEYSITVSDNAGNQQTIDITLLDETVPVIPCTEPFDIVIRNDVSGSVDNI